MTFKKERESRVTNVYRGFSAVKITEKDSSSVSILSYLIPKKDIYFLPPCINGNLAADEIAFILRPPLLVLRPQTARRLLRYLILEPLKFGESQIMFPHAYPFEYYAMKGQIHFRFCCRVGFSKYCTRTFNYPDIKYTKIHTYCTYYLDRSGIRIVFGYSDEKYPDTNSF